MVSSKSVKYQFWLNYPFKHFCPVALQFFYSVFLRLKLKAQQFRHSNEWISSFSHYYADYFTVIWILSKRDACLQRRAYQRHMLSNKKHCVCVGV